MSKVKKGTAGYIRYEKKRRLMVTLLLFALPVGLYVIGLVVTGTRLNWLTIIAIVGCLPACKSMVGLILMLMQKPVAGEVAARTAAAAGDLVAASELIFTTYEHTTPVSAAVVCGNQVLCYTPDEKTKPSELEAHLKRILASNGFSSIQVRVFRDLNTYCQRAEHLRDHREKYRAGIPFTPDERYPDLSREELIMHTLYAVSL